MDLTWQLSDGSQHRESLHSRDLSQHGVGLTGSSNFWPAADRVIEVHHVESGRRAAGYIVWCEEKKNEGSTRAGLEFLGVEDFWGIEFEPDSDYPEPESPGVRRVLPLD